MFRKFLGKLFFYRDYFLIDLPIKYRQKYSLLYPHGVLRRLTKRYPQFGRIQVFVETGTFRGKTARIESRFFREVHTIELNEDLYIENLPVFQRDFPNISAYLGDSAVVLPRVLERIQEPCLIFLDAHWSGDKRVNWNSSAWKGYDTDTSYRGTTWPPSPEQQCPLVDEVIAIGKYFKFPALLVIDDWAVVGTRDAAFVGEDWSTISLERIMNGLGRDRIVEYFETEYAGKKRMNILIAAA